MSHGARWWPPTEPHLLSLARRVSDDVSRQGTSTHRSRMLLQWLCNDNAPSYCRDEIDDVRYHKEADHTLEYLVEAFENLLDGIDADDADVELSQGVLNLNLGSIGTYVINKQTPNKQIWVSSPVSGPVRYDFVKGFWTYKRDGHLFHQRLEEEIKALTGVDIDLNPCSHCGKRNACADNYECVK